MDTKAFQKSESVKKSNGITAVFQAALVTVRLIQVVISDEVGEPIVQN